MLNAESQKVFRTNEIFRAKKLTGYIRAFERKGIPAEELLVGTGIEFSQTLAAGVSGLSIEQYHRVVANMMQATQDSGVAFSIGETLNLTEFGIVGYAMLSATTLRKSVAVWIAYSNSLVGAPIRFRSVCDKAPGFEMEVVSSPIDSRLGRFETEELLVHWMRVIRYLSGIEPVLGEIEFSYPEPAYRARYDEVFKCPLKFETAKTAVRFLSPGLDVPVVSTNDEMFRLCIRQCEEILHHHDDFGLLRSRLRRQFMTAPSLLPDMKTVGAILGMSERSLCRRLEATGESYQAIKDEFRFDLAREYLLSGSMSQKQVAYSLGFSSPSTFSRAFRGWAGLSVREFLAKNKQVHGS